MDRVICYWTRIPLHPRIKPDQIRVNVLPSTGLPVESIEIYTIHGHLISKHRNINEIELGHLPPGIYALKVKHAEGIQIQKLTIQ